MAKPVVAIVGRPNVGKSSLVNAFTGQQRMIVSSIAGTTRDAIDTELEYRGEKFRLIDTAGIRDANDPLESAGIGLARDTPGTAAAQPIDPVVRKSDRRRPRLSPDRAHQVLRA